MAPFPDQKPFDTSRTPTIHITIHLGDAVYIAINLGETVLKRLPPVSGGKPPDAAGDPSIV